MIQPASAKESQKQSNPMNEKQKQATAKKVVEHLLDEYALNPNPGAPPADDQWRKSNELDGAQSGKFKFKILRPIEAFHCDQDPENSRDIGRVRKLNPGTYQKGSAYISPAYGEERGGPGELDSAYFHATQEYSQNWRHVVDPAAKEWLKQSTELYPCIPEGEDTSTTNIYWVRMNDIVANGKILTPLKGFADAEDEVVGDVKGQVDELRRLLMADLVTHAVNVKDPEDVWKAFDRFEKIVIERFENIYDSGKRTDELMDFLEQEVFNYVLKNEFGATDEDLEV